MLDDLIRDYLDYADRELGCTAKTIYSYRYQFTLFVRYVGNISLSSITIDDINQYFRSEEERGLAIASVNTARGNIRSFFYYCQHYRQIPMLFDSKMIRQKKCDPTETKVATEDDIRRALDVLTDVQDKLIILTLSQTCMRVGELVRLRVEDINGCEVSVLVGKGRKRRPTCITPELSMALQKHMTDNDIRTGPVFRHRVTKTSLVNKGYSVSGLRNRFRRKLNPHGIYAGFHWYRHGGATEMLRNGADIMFLKEYLGHADVRTTQRYLHITDKDKRESFEKYYKSKINIAEVLT